MAQVSNPFSSGGGGHNFETRVQASFAVLMLAGGFAPCLQPWPIKKIKLQGKHDGLDGYNFDDLIVFTEKPRGGNKRRLLYQIKSYIKITKNSKLFSEVIKSAWDDYNNSSIFTKRKDCIALITGPLSSTDTNYVRSLLEWARGRKDHQEFFTDVDRGLFSSKGKQDKLEVFRTQLKNANGGTELSDEELFDFLKLFHLLGYDLDVKAGVIRSLLHSVIGQHRMDDVHGLWAKIIDTVQYANQNGETITVDSFSEDIREVFVRPEEQTIPPQFADVTPQPVAPTHDLAIANLLGKWSERSEADKKIVGSLANKDFEEWLEGMREVLK